MQLRCECYNPQRMLFTSRNITMNYNECYQVFIGVTLMWPYKSSHLLVSFNRSSLDNNNLPLGSARFALRRLLSMPPMALTKNR